MRIARAVFVVMICGMLCGPTLLFCAEKAGVALPLDMTSKGAEYLVGGKAKVDPKAMSFDGFLTSKFQEAAEAYLSNHIPAKGAAMLGYASLQRGCIAASDVIFGWKSYPTFYGSSRLRLPYENALMLMPEKGTQSAQTRLERFKTALSDFAEKHQGIEIGIVIADLSSLSENNPALDYVSDSVSAVDLFADLQDLSPALPNVKVVSMFSRTKYFDYYYTTDHHWNGFGAQAAYRALAKNRLQEESSGNLHESGESGLLKMNGSLARTGLDLIDEPINEPTLMVQNMRVTSGTIPLILSGRDVLKTPYENQKIRFDFYHTWYGPSTETIIENEGGDLLTDALVVCDSFGSAFQWFVAQDHRATYTYYDLHGDTKEAPSLEDRLEELGVKKIYIVAQIENIANLLTRFPGYFASV